MFSRREWRVRIKTHALMAHRKRRRAFTAGVIPFSNQTTRVHIAVFVSGFLLGLLDVFWWRKDSARDN